MRLERWKDMDEFIRAIEWQEVVVWPMMLSVQWECEQVELGIGWVLVDGSAGGWVLASCCPSRRSPSASTSVVCLKSHV